MEFKFADRMGNLKASAIREILKFATDPSVISFAAGNPAPEAFPQNFLGNFAGTSHRCTAIQHF